MNLFVNYYQDKDKSRQKELDTCLNNNLKNQYLNVIIIESSDRLQYSDYFSFMANYSRSDDINIICNLDIYFDATVELCNKITNRQFYCIGRWDILTNGQAKHANRPDSQDVWVCRGVPRINGKFFLGIKGCDNKIAYEAKAAGYQVINPSCSIKCYHLHCSKKRNYGARDVVPGPYYTLSPTALT